LWHEVGVKDRDIGRFGVLKAKRKVSRLKPGAHATAQNLEIHIVRHNGTHRFGQPLMIVRTAIVEQLDLQPVTWPIEARRGLGYP
jgi:hypothetical protein